MKYEMLGVIATVLLLAGCNSEDSGGGGGLSFDVTGHWQLSADMDGSGEKPILNVVVDPKGRFMGTANKTTLVGHQNDSVRLDGDGVIGQGFSCEDTPQGYVCQDVTFKLDIFDDSTTNGTMKLVNKEDDSVLVLEVTLVRLPELTNKVVDISEIAGSWESATGYSTVIQINTDGSFSAVNGGAQFIDGTYEQIKGTNVARFEGDLSLENGATETINGLGFINTNDQLHLGGFVDIDDNSFTVGDSYKQITP